MEKKLRLGIDLDNGDLLEGKNATERILEGVKEFSKQKPHLELTLYAHKDKELGLQRRELPNTKGVSVTRLYAPHDRLTRRIEGTSLHHMIGDIEKGEIDGIFTLCDTARVAMEASRIRDKSLGKPALVGSFPTFKGNEFICTDLGLTSQRSTAKLHTDAVGMMASTIYTQALMATAYMQHRGITRPRWGILSNGTEEHKGSDIDLQLDEIITHQLKESNLETIITYQGRVEPNDCYNDNVDIVLTDGYKGNTFLKTSEAIAKLIGMITREELTKLAPLEKMRLGLVKGPLKKVKSGIQERINPDRYGGALALGYAGPIVKGHGASTTEAVYYGLERLASFAGNTFNEALQSLVETYQLKK